MARSQILTLGIFTSLILAATPAITSELSITQWKFKSVFDRFSLKKSGNYWAIKGKRVDVKVLEDFTPLFQSELGGQECFDLPKKPDIEIRARLGNKWVKRSFYLEQRTVTDGNSCIALEGEGLYYIPLHRVWFSNKKQISIPLNSDFQVTTPRGETIEFTKTNKEWRNKNPLYFVNWNFFEEFRSALQDISISARVHPGIAKDAEHFKLTIGKNVYEFFQVKENLWAIRMPKVKWLVIARDLAKFEDFGPRKWRDRHFNRLQIAMDESRLIQDRLKAFKMIGSAWSKAIKFGLQHIALDPKMNKAIKHKAVSLLKRHPSDENILVLTRALSQTDDLGLLYTITHALRVRNPKGPSVEESDDPDKVKTTIKYWQDWSQSLKPSKTK